MDRDVFMIVVRSLHTERIIAAKTYWPTQSIPGKMVWTKTCFAVCYFVT